MLSESSNHSIGGGEGGAGGAEAPLNENLGGLSAPRFGPENIGNAAENWFGKIFLLVIFSQWSRLAKYYFLGLFEQLHSDFEKPINCCLQAGKKFLRANEQRKRHFGKYE